MKIGVISDTHSFLHPHLFDFFAPCNEIWHAGDIGSLELLAQFENFKPLRAVYGNIDDIVIREKLRDHLFFKAGGLKILLTHIGGRPPRYNKISKSLIATYNPDIFICGHSHILRVVHDNKYKLLYINPGAAGNFGDHKAITFLRFDIEKKRPANMELFHEDRK
jgi:putative phosphoesterase